MKVQRFSLERQYEIKCKLFAPDEGEVTHLIVGVHGFAGDKESSMLETLAFACRDTALICFDFPAHGDSPVGEECLTVENCQQDLLTVIDYATKQYPRAKKSIFATSFGGYITLLSADWLQGFSLVLRAPAVTMPKLLTETVLKISPEQFREAGTVRCGFERPIDLPCAFYEELLRRGDVCQKQIAPPTLVIHGDCDDIVPLEDIQAFMAAQPNARLQIIPGADHRFKNSGETEAIIGYTKDFLQRKSI